MFSQHTPSVSPTGQPLITTEFDASSTASEVVVGHDLSGLRVVVTGGASGIGLPTARALVAAGADVTIARRDVAAGAGAAASMSHHGGGGTARAGVLDLADAASVARFAESGDGPLHLLVANAGVVTGGLERTREGWELQLATNHLGHLALAQRLRGALTAGAADRGAARVIVLSSTAHMRAGVDFDDLQFERRP